MSRRSVSIGRRTLLHGAGVTLGLPWLEAMMPSGTRAARAAGANKASARTRMAFIFQPNGMNTADFMPTSEGADYALTPTLEPLGEFRRDFMVLSGLGQKKGVGGGHSLNSAAFLTGAAARRGTATDIFVGESIDQLCARKLGMRTRVSSLQLGCDRGKQAGVCDNGDAFAYLFNMSWKTPTVPLPPEVDPRTVFEKLFGAPSDHDGKIETARHRQDKSVLDFVSDGLKELTQDLGVADRRKLEEFSTSVRDVEVQIEQAEKFHRPHTSYRSPSGIPAEYPKHLRLMYDLMALAFQTDSTRIATFYAAHEESNRSYGFIDIPEAHHDLSHHKGDPAVLAKLTRINRFHMEQFAYFLGKLHAIKEGDATVLDSSMVMLGASLADGNMHNAWDLPLLLAGRGGGTIDSGRHLRYAKHTLLCDLYLSMLDRMGLDENGFGPSTQRLPGLRVGEALPPRGPDFDEKRTPGWKAAVTRPAAKA